MALASSARVLVTQGLYYRAPLIPTNREVKGSKPGLELRRHGGPSSCLITEIGGKRCPH